MSSEATTVLLKKRERTQNWVPEEKSALFALIKLHVNAIENKKIDQAASAMKALAWQQIHSAFRGRFSADRDMVRIREQWRRMKAQARIEMHTHAEKVRTLGPEVAAKSRPSNLSIEVWRLMESVRRNDCDADRSDDSSSQDTHENPNRTSAIHAILDNLTSPTTPETSAPGQEIKIEVNSDTYHSEEDEGSHGEFSRKLSDDFSPKKRPKMAAQNEEVSGSVEQKVARADGGGAATSRLDDATDDGDGDGGGGGDAGNAQLSFARDDRGSEENEAMRRRATWLYKSTRREHEMKLRTLQIELERAELQKQTAVNELKTSEIKRQLIESQAAEYYSQVRMSGERGSGAGKGGGGGGAIRDAGGSFGKMEAAHEDQYFYNLQKQQLQKMRESLHDEISFHEEQIKRHQEAINRHKKRITEMEHKE